MDKRPTTEAGAELPAQIGPYRIGAALGAGAMGEVFRGVHTELGRPVAIKILRPTFSADDSMVERFFSEARAVNLIRHENIVDCTDLVRDDSGRAYMVMELLEGRSLTALIRESAPLPWTRAVPIVEQIAAALGAAHGKGIVHRDLKPDNVFLIQRTGTDDYVKILDFGIAHLSPSAGGAAATAAGTRIGTPAYMAPEQVRGESVSPSSDIYALGVVFFELLTGRLPFEASSAVEIMMKHLETPAPSLAATTRLPTPLSELVDAMLEKAPEKRPPSMARVAQVLAELSARGLRSSNRVVTPTPSLSGTEETALGPRSRLSSPRFLIGLAGLGIAGAIIAFLSLRGVERPGVAEADAGLGARQHLDQAWRAANLPSVPPGCQSRDADEQAILTASLARVAGGDLREVRARDREALGPLEALASPSPEALAIRARARLKNGDPEGAIQAAEAALKSCPELAFAHATRGAAHLARGDATTASSSFERALELAADYTDVRFNLGLARLALGDTGAAIAAFDQVEATRPSYPELRLVRGEARLIAQDYAGAIVDLENAARGGSEPGRVQLALGHALRGVGRPDDASAAFCAAARAGEERAKALCPAP